MAAGVAAGQLLGPVGEASASLAQGRTAALLHPASMAGMLALSLWAGWLGLQWKRARCVARQDLLQSVLSVFCTFPRYSPTKAIFSDGEM